MLTPLFNRDKAREPFTCFRDPLRLVGRPDSLDEMRHGLLQVHSIKAGSGPFDVSWRKLRIKEL
ncbi:MAG: hypothetical protein ABGZ24_06360, partial [Fuerstiella sp.]